MDSAGDCSCHFQRFEASKHPPSIQLTQACRRCCNADSALLFSIWMIGGITCSIGLAIVCEGGVAAAAVVAAAAMVA